MATSSSSLQGAGSQSPPPPDSVIVTDLPRIDIDSYIQNYTGRTRFERLLLIGKSCVPLRVEALKAAVAEAKKGFDVNRYKEAWEQLRLSAPNDPDSQRDEEWIEQTDAANKQETARLETELKIYRNNLIKESIRMGNEDLGKHFEEIGKLTEAAAAYTSMRPDASTTKHIVECGTHLANIALQRRDFHVALQNVGKFANIQTGDDDEKATLAYAKTVSGVALLGLGQYLDAAKNFIVIDPEAPSSVYSHIASTSDIAVCGGLLALATMDRKDLQAKILENSSFRVFLEQEPLLRKAIVQYVNGRYSSCSEILESVRADYSLDVYLQRHISEIYTKIRAKCIVSYLIPYSTVTLESLEAMFSAPGLFVERELVNMIRDGSLKARIDTKNRLLVAVRPDPRQAMQNNALNVARKYEKEAKERLRRMNIIAAGLEVSGNKKNASSSATGALTLDEAWYEEDSPAIPFIEDAETHGEA